MATILASTVAASSSHIIGSLAVIGSKCSRKCQTVVRNNCCTLHSELTHLVFCRKVSVKLPPVALQVRFWISLYWYVSPAAIESVVPVSGSSPVGHAHIEQSYSWDQSAGSDKTVVSICIDLNNFCASRQLSTHLARRNPRHRRTLASSRGPRACRSEISCLVLRPQN
jgi:hypothetical protein